jgi:hypothetical protein
MLIVSPSRGLIRVPIDGAGSDIQAGAMLKPGSTEGGNSSDNYGLAVLADETGADAIGILTGLHDYSVKGDSDTYTGAAHVMAEVDPFYPGCLVAVEHDLTDTQAIASMQSITQVRITGVEDHLSAGWLYVYSGTGSGQLVFIKFDDATDLFLKGAPTTALVAADSTVHVIPPLFHGLLHLNTAMTQIGSDAGAGTWTARVLRNQIRYDGQEGWIDLDPGLHHNLQLSGLNAKIRSIVTPINTLWDN